MSRTKEFSAKPVQFFSLLIFASFFVFIFGLLSSHCFLISFSILFFFQTFSLIRPLSFILIFHYFLRFLLFFSLFIFFFLLYLWHFFYFFFIGFIFVYLFLFFYSVFVSLFPFPSSCFSPFWFFTVTRPFPSSFPFFPFFFFLSFSFLLTISPSFLSVFCFVLSFHSSSYIPLSICTAFFLQYILVFFFMLSH